MRSRKDSSSADEQTTNVERQATAPGGRISSYMVGVAPTESLRARAASCSSGWPCPLPGCLVVSWCKIRAASFAVRGYAPRKRRLAAESAHVSWLTRALCWLGWSLSFWPRACPHHTTGERAERDTRRAPPTRRGPTRLPAAPGRARVHPPTILCSQLYTPQQRWVGVACGFTVGGGTNFFSGGAVRCGAPKRPFGARA